MTASSLLWGVLFGALGMGYFVFGKTQRAIVDLARAVLALVFDHEQIPEGGEVVSGAKHVLRTDVLSGK